MLPSSTVENYLKALYKAQAALEDPETLVPMGHLASALGVAPGTATTMVKALAESGLVRYEPYSGVRLTPAGEKLAALVLRRHRLIELFLVKVMGMSWTEVHDEAEQLEHAVSDRLIDRIDEILGRPATDPHGDPIPDAQGTVERHHYETLLTCPLHRPLVVARVADQDADFLRFLETSDLTPGQTIEVEARDEVADRVRLRGKANRRITIGMRAASKLLVNIASALVLWLYVAGVARAQAPAPDTPEPVQILDNSFLYTQEWPVQTLRHQLLTEEPGQPALSPRLSIILPSGSEEKGLGTGTVGWQVNLPFSKQAGDVYWHWNGGFTHLPGVDVGTRLRDGAEDEPDDGPSSRISDLAGGAHVPLDAGGRGPF